MSFLVRKAAAHLKPDVDISKDCDEWCIKSMSTFKNTELKFKLGEELDETTADGRKVKTTITCENGVLIQKQCWDGKESTITREVKDGRMVTVSIEISNDHVLNANWSKSFHYLSTILNGYRVLLSPTGPSDSELWRCSLLDMLLSNMVLYSDPNKEQGLYITVERIL